MHSLLFVGLPEIAPVNGLLSEGVIAFKKSIRCCKGHDCLGAACRKDRAVSAISYKLEIDIAKEEKLKDAK